MGSAAIVPTAGRSRRMGRPKWRLPYQGRTVLGAVVEALREGGATKIVVVIPPDDSELTSWARRQQVVAAVNPDPSRGMLSSIAAGLEALGGAESLASSTTPLLVCPGDLPGLASETTRRVLETLATTKSPLVVPCYRGRRGHPLAIAPQLVPEIQGLDPDVGLRQILARHASGVLELAVDDPGCVRDLNTPEDYERATRG